MEVGFYDVMIESNSLSVLFSVISIDFLLEDPNFLVFSFFF